MLSLVPRWSAAAALCCGWLLVACTATPIEIPGADGGAPPAPDSSATGLPDSGSGPMMDAAASPPDMGAARDAFVGDGFDFNAAMDTALTAEATYELPELVTAMHADATGLIVAAGKELYHWAHGDPTPAPLATAPAPVRLISTAVSAPGRVYFSSDAGIHSVARSGGAADLKTHFAPSGGTPFYGGVAVGTSWLFFTHDNKVWRLALAGDGVTPEELYKGPHVAPTVGPFITALADLAFFADFDGPRVADEQGQVKLLGAPRANYRWARAAVEPGALWVAQTGDFNEAITRIALPSGTEEVLIWIGGANNNSGLYGPVVFASDHVVWGSSTGVFLTPSATPTATKRLVDTAARLAGDASSDLLYWAPLQGKTVKRAKLPPATP